jgi:hypothetical protein
MSTTNNPNPLWPQPIPIIGVTGEFAAGKTLFGLTIDPRHTRVYDTEASSTSYASLRFDRVDVPGEMMKAKPKGYKPVDTFLWWRDHVRAIEPGRFRVIVLDTVSEIESGLVDWVASHPQEFGRTPSQYTKMAGLMWGDVKELWKAILSDLASRCETFVFAAHMANVWKGDSPTGKRKPKGKETLFELASLYLQLERRPDAKGNVPAQPAAVVLKSRLAYTGLSDDGSIVIVPALPPRLPIATPAEIRRYMVEPPDYAKLKAGERAPEAVMSEDDRAAVKLATAEAEAETERLRLDRLQREQEREEKRKTEAEAKANKDAATRQTAEATKAVAAQTTANGSGPAKPPTTGEQPSKGPLSTAKASITNQQAIRLKELRNRLFAEMGIADDETACAEHWHKILSKRDCVTARELSETQAEALCGSIAHQLTCSEMQTDLEKGGAPGGSAKRT